METGRLIPSQMHLCSVKYNQPHLGFELGYSIPLLAAISITLDLKIIYAVSVEYS